MKTNANTKKVTLDDIAARLSLSKSVVSRALNDKYGVREETRSKILFTALEMGYDFEHARGMTKPKKRTTKNICVVIPQAHFLDEAYYNKILFGIESALNAQKTGIHLLIPEKSGFSEMLMNLKKLDFDGIIIIGLLPYQNISLLVSINIPIVLVDTLHYDLDVDCLTCNNYRGAFHATKYLLDQNHRSLAFLGTVDPRLNFSDRYRGYKDCLEQSNIEGIVDYSVVEPHSDDDFMFSTDRIYNLLRQKNRPTAILCANDQVAFKVYEIADSLQLSIPEDLSVIGFDNIERCNWMKPKLTSIHVPKFEMGKEAVSMLMRQIENRSMGIKDAPAKSLMLDTRLDIKESVCSR